MLALLALAGAMLSACTPAPAPSPTPTTAFANEEEAFAAAEEVYRAYLLAAAERADGDATANPEEYLSGEALEADLQSQRNLQEQGIRIVGPSVVHNFTGLDADLSGRVSTLTADVCVDISGSRVLNEAGTDVTPNNRPELGLLKVEFSGNSDELFIARSSPSEKTKC